jgi:hypothetical protein
MAAGSELAAFETRFGNSERFPRSSGRWCKTWTTTESKLLSWLTVVPSICVGACLTLAFLQFIVVGSSRLRKSHVRTVAVVTIVQQVQDQVYKELFNLTKSPFSVRGNIRGNKGKR